MVKKTYLMRDNFHEMRQKGCKSISTFFETKILKKTLLKKDETKIY